ncbi:pogo transposable element with KRAB domain [Octopus vulgaris]|uniref:Pogo transposable element with KRAB domain n=1 Tax=Octopus vulgaris TaxID=6645 RepID=A0AA36FGI9_OCTVU|nr:pogo transposable element with KRAB domain [Octopus vulgaris]
MKALYCKYIANHDHDFTISGKIQKASMQPIVSCLKQAWNFIDSDTITRSYKKKCCKTIALDGLEDDVMWQEIDDEDETNATEQLMENDIDLV